MAGVQFEMGERIFSMIDSSAETHWIRTQLQTYNTRHFCQLLEAPDTPDSFTYPANFRKITTQ